MSDAILSPLREIGNKFRQDVGATRTTMFELILKLSLINGQWSDEIEEEIAQIVQKTKNAQTALEVTLIRSFKSIGVEMPDSIDNTREKAIEALENFQQKSKIAIASAKSGSDFQQALLALDELAHEKTRPDVESFLSALAQFVEKEESKRTTNERNLITTAISQIDHISTSINLISVNASVEAARAGEFGKGFAVIAAEIQTLSSQSKQAVDDIRAGMKN